MAKERIGPEVHVPLSPALRSGDFVFVSGQVPTTPDGRVVEGGIKEQTRVVLDKIKALLEEAGLGMEDVVKTTVFLADKDDFGAMNEVYREYFSGVLPARTTVVVQLAIDAKVEIEAVAMRR